MAESILAVALLLLLAWGLRRWLAHGDRGWMPLELRRATLVYAEQLFRASGPVTLTAKVDRAYRASRGHLVLVELKTRRAARPYLSDVIELSAQRVAIMRRTGEDVASHAYVVVQDLAGRRTRHKVALLSTTEVDELARRREAILDGTLQPRGACVPSLCRQCGFERTCTKAPSVHR